MQNQTARHKGKIKKKNKKQIGGEKKKIGK